MAKTTAPAALPAALLDDDDVIEINAEPVKKKKVRLVDELYEVTPPKSSLAIKLAVRAKTVAADDPSKVLDVLDEWISKAFGKAGAKNIHKRLDDAEDDLDITHIMALMEKMVEASTGDPTS